MMDFFRSGANPVNTVFLAVIVIGLGCLGCNKTKTLLQTEYDWESLPKVKDLKKITSEKDAAAVAKAVMHRHFERALAHNYKDPWNVKLVVIPLKNSDQTSWEIRVETRERLPKYGCTVYLEPDSTLSMNVSPNPKCGVNQ